MLELQKPEMIKPSFLKLCERSHDQYYITFSCVLLPIRKGQISFKGDKNSRRKSVKAQDFSEVLHNIFLIYKKKYVLNYILVNKEKSPVLNPTSS